MLGAGNEESQHQMLEQTTKNGRQSRVRILFLAAKARLFRTKQTKKEPACSVAEQAGVPRERKGLFNLLTLESIGLVATENEDLTILHHFVDFRCVCVVENIFYVISIPLGNTLNISVKLSPYIRRLI